MELTKIEALQAYARMMNTLDSSSIEHLLADDFHYTSQWVLEEISSKLAFLDYIKPKLKTISQTGSLVYAEMAELKAYGGGPCVVMAQDFRESLLATVLAEVNGNFIIRIGMCFIPPPSATKRSGKYPI